MLDGADARILLGQAVFECWGFLPRDIQETIFQRAIHKKSDDVREELAKQLHEAHPRTDHS